LFNRSIIEHQGNHQKLDNYRILDKYSWFLYLAGNYEEADSVNQQATHFVKKYMELNPNEPEIKVIFENILSHGKHINDRTWTELKN